MTCLNVPMGVFAKNRNVHRAHRGLCSVPSASSAEAGCNKKILLDTTVVSREKNFCSGFWKEPWGVRFKEDS